MSKINWSLIRAIVVVCAVIVALYSVKVHAHDPSHHELDEWYAGLMMPDAPQVSCCGEADAYWADEVHFKDGQTIAVITDDRDDRDLHNRRHVPIGTEIVIPNHKLKYDRGNPTGHGVVFLGHGNTVYCYVQPGGV